MANVGPGATNFATSYQRKFGKRSIRFKLAGMHRSCHDVEETWKERISWRTNIDKSTSDHDFRAQELSSKVKVNGIAADLWRAKENKSLQGENLDLSLR